MKALIIGCSGQDGHLLAKELNRNNWVVFGSYPALNELGVVNPFIHRDNLYEIDVRAGETLDLINNTNPDVIFYLAGITSIAESWQDPISTMEINTTAYLKILNYFLKNEVDKLLVFASSTEIFKSDDVIHENSIMEASSPYGVSKISATQLGRIYRDKGLFVANAILGNHESYLRDDRFVTGKIAKGVAKIYLGLEKNIILGNIEVEKNWSSAIDMVCGLRLIGEKRLSSDLILASENLTSLRHLISIAFHSVGIPNWEDYVVTDKTLYRNNENKTPKYSVSKAKKELGWRAAIPAEVWMKEMVEFHLTQNNL